MIKEFNKILEEQGIVSFVYKFDQVLTKKISAAVLGQEDYSTLGNSRIGGLPDLPKLWNYPIYKNNKFPRFIAQINFDEFEHTNNLLPKSGIMYFFEGSTDNNEIVILYTTEKANLETKQIPVERKPFYLVDYGDDDYDEGIYTYESFRVKYQENYQFKDYSITKELENEHPEIYHKILYRITQSEFTDIADAELLGVHPYEDMTQVFYLSDCGLGTLNWFSWLFVDDNYPQYREAKMKIIQDELEGKTKPNGIYNKVGRDNYLKKQLEDLETFDRNRDFHKVQVNNIIHLFSVKSLGTMMWSDAGTVSYYIKIDDLKAMSFNKIFVDTWSS